MNGLALCAGVGGLELGLRELGVRTVCYVERDAFAASVLVGRMADSSLDPAPVWDDLSTFSGGAWRGVVDCVSAGYPCQPFSVAGKRLGEEDERHLWPDVARIIREVGPRYVFLENVSGHVRLGLDVVLGDLAELGFSAEWGTLRAADVGAPHLRDRVFVFAYADVGGREFEWGGGLLDGERSALGDDVDGCGRESGGGWWETESHVRRVVDGAPFGLDRLRCLGNAVVPQQAAVAFRGLIERSAV